MNKIRKYRRFWISLRAVANSLLSPSISLIFPNNVVVKHSIRSGKDNQNSFLWTCVDGIFFFFTFTESMDNPHVQWYIEWIRKLISIGGYKLKSFEACESPINEPKVIALYVFICTGRFWVDSLTKSYSNNIEWLKR